MRPGDTWEMQRTASQRIKWALRVEGAAVAEAARAYLGVPWRHMGRDRHGLDCVGLVLCVLRDLGTPVDDPGDYPLGLRGAPIHQAIAARGGRRLHVDAAQIGDVLVMADGRHDGHLAIKSGVPNTGRAGVIHATAKARRVVEQPLEWENLRSLRAAYRLPVAEPI